MTPRTAKIIRFPQRRGLEPYLTASELADVLGMSERWIAYRRAEGMPSHLFGRARRFRLSEVESWLTERAKKA